MATTRAVRYAVYRTAEYLESRQLLLAPSVRHVRVFQPTRPRSAPLQHFLYEDVPPLKFHNPHVKFEIERVTEATASPRAMEVTVASGERLTIPLEGQSQTSLLAALQRIGS